MLSLPEYLKANKGKFNILYYPGSGMDLSPLYIFGILGNTKSTYFADYFKSYFDSVADNFDIFNVASLNPQDFNRHSWDEFWYDHPDAKDFSVDPEIAGGLSFEIALPNLVNEQVAEVTYLNTEAVGTAKILLENGIRPDVVVLQDHGFGGEWTRFDGELFRNQFAPDYLPEYLYVAVDGPTSDPWPGYSQVTEPFNPEKQVILPGFFCPEKYLPMHKNSRALFKRDA